MLTSLVLFFTFLEQDFGKESLSEVGMDEDSESETEDGNDTNNDEEHLSDNEPRCIENEEYDPVRESAEAALAAAEAFNNLTSKLGIEATFASVNNFSRILSGDNGSF